MAGFKKATKQAKNLVFSIQGASGAGKTYSALNIAQYLCPAGKRIAFIDTERSARLYSDIFDFDIDDNFGEFGKINYEPEVWISKLKSAASCGEYGVVILDSLTHMWKGEGGILSKVDNIVKQQRARGGKGDSHAAWKNVDPVYAKFMNALRHLPFHVIFCLRAKQDYDKSTPGKLVKLGLSAEFREGFDYDVDAQLIMDEDHNLMAKKHRLREYLDGKVFPKPGKDFADVCLEWLENGSSEPNTPDPSTPPETQRDPAPVNDYLAQINAATTADELAAVGAEIKKAKADGLVTPELHKELTTAFMARSKSL